jgi:hypothetical protein
MATAAVSLDVIAPGKPDDADGMVGQAHFVRTSSPATGCR